MRTLIVNPFGIGDVLFSLPLVRALRATDPEGLLGYLCNRRTADLVASLRELDWHRVFEKDEFRAVWKRSKIEGLGCLGQLLREVREKQFDLLIDLSLGWQSGFGAILAGIPKRIGFNFRNRGRFLTHALPIQGFHTQSVAEYYLDLLSLLNIPKPATVQADFLLPPGIDHQVEEYLRQQRVPPGRRLVGVIPGGGASWGPNAIYKQWAPDRFAQVADHIASRHQAQILLFGDSKELPLCQKVLQAMECKPRLATEVPSLLLLAGLLRQCALVVGNDGGAMHLATAVGTKTVSLFGPVDGSVYGPFPPNLLHRVVTQGFVCQPCYQGFRFPPCPWDNACLKKLEVKPVLEAVDELMA